MASFEVAGDWVLNDKGTDLVLVTGVDQLQQAIKIGIEIAAPFYPFDVEAGIPYFLEVFGENPDLSAIRTILEDFMLAFELVSSVDQLELTLDKEVRTLNVDYIITTNTGENFADDLIYGRAD